MKKFKDIMNAHANKFTVSLVNMSRDLDMIEMGAIEKDEGPIEFGKFDTKNEANKFKRELKKKYDLVNYGGTLVNTKDGILIHTNY